VRSASAQITGAKHGQAKEKAQESHQEAEVSQEAEAQDPDAVGSAAAAAQLAGTSGLHRGFTLPLVLLAVVATALVASAIGPTDRLTWWLEVAPVLIAAPLLILSARRFPLTNLLYVLIAIHALILILGGHYTYAHVPPGGPVRPVA
jgi:hypothetical protein